MGVILVQPLVDVALLLAGQRPVETNKRLQRDPHFCDYLHFYEYFHGDTGRGIGSSHQTGWTGLIAKILQPRLISTDG